MLAQGKIWGVTTKGNVYTLDTSDSRWIYVPNQGQVLRGFKRVSSCTDGAWGLGCDHQVYVFVTASDVPIRCPVTTYENERWVPARGWSSNHLLPGVDPWQWSSEDGNVHMPRTVFKLPSDNWQWESDWSVDENVQGFFTDKGGWRYSNVDFHGQFSHQKSFRSCVRRRKWIRHYRYVSMGMWARIQSIHVDPLEEPIVDLAAGGQDIPNQSPGFVAVWAVTIDGRVLYRTGISRLCPEGLAWVDVPIEDGDEVLSIAVGPTDIVWATTWAGHLLLRTGVNWQNPRGTAWLRLNAPMSEDKLVQIAAGHKSVWATTVTGHVWFRKGLKDSSDKKDLDNVRGSGWLRMVNMMKMLTIGPGDRVWGIDYDSRKVYFRQGISAEEPTGRKWSHLTVPLALAHGVSITKRPTSQISLTSSASSGSSPTDFITSDHQNQTQNNSNHSLVAEMAPFPQKSEGSWMKEIESTLSEHDIKLTNLDRQFEDELNGNIVPVSSILKVRKSKSAPTNINISGSPTYSERTKKRSGPHQLVHNIQIKAKAKSKKVVNFLRDRITKDLLTAEASDDSDDAFSVRFSSTTSALELNYQVQDEETSSLSSLSVQRENSASVVIGGDGDRSSGDVGEISLDTQPDTDDVLWLWLSANACHINDQSPVSHWFSPREAVDVSPRVSLLYQRQLSYSTWRSRVIEKLKERNEKIQVPFSHYTVAIERSCWTKKVQLKWWRDIQKKPKWLTANVELVKDSDTCEKDGVFTIQYESRKQPKHLMFSLRDIAGVTIATDPKYGPIMALHLVSRIRSLPRQPPIRCAASNEEELEDWVAMLSVACCDHRGISGATHPCSLWSVTDRGDIFIHEPDPYLPTESSIDMFWHQFGGHMSRVESCPAGVTWAIAHDGKPYVYTEAYGGGFFKGMASSPHGINKQSDSMEMHVYENQRWRPISGYTDRMLFTDGYSWSDKSGRCQVTKDGTKLPSKQWTWVTDWMIDRKLEGGVDKEGWQYGRKINRPFYSQPRINSVIRRRRWIRRCSLMTSGPWEEVGPHTLQDVSLQLDSTLVTDRLIPDVSVWAVSRAGEVLYRTGVSRANTQGVSWVHVPTDVPFTSISIGGSHRVWATADDGSLWLRHGANTDNPIGDFWSHVSPPAGAHFTKISAGTTSVWAVDSHKRLWSRKGVTIAQPEGKDWIQVAYNIRDISCGQYNQVWVIQDQVLTAEGLTDGIICRRVGLLSDLTNHGSWAYGIGGGFNQICCRGWIK